MSDRLRILCFGNSLHGDDGFGPAVAQALQQQALPPDVRVIDCGIRGIDALPWFEDCLEIILVDAIAGTTSGALRILDAAAVPPEPAGSGSHGAGVGHLLAAVRELLPNPPRITVIAAEITRANGFVSSLSAPLTAAVAKALEWIHPHFQNKNSASLQELSDEIDVLRQANRALETELIASTQTLEKLISAQEQQHDELQMRSVELGQLHGTMERAIATKAEVFVLLDTSGRIVKANAVIEQELGHATSTLIGSFLEDLLTQESLSQIEDLLPRHTGQSLLLAAIRANGGHFAAELDFRHADGSKTDTARVSYLLHAGLLHSPAGKLEGAVVVADNISVLKAREQALRESEEKNRLVLASTLDAVVSINGADRVTGWNRIAENLFGWTAEETLGQSLSNLIIPESLRQAHLAGMQRCLETGESKLLNHFLELPALHKRGHELTIEFSVTRQYLNGEIQFTAFMRDITSRKQAEHALRESEMRFQSLFERSPTALSVTTEDDGFKATRWNQTWLDQFGYPPEAAQGKSGNELGLWADPAVRDHYIRLADQTGDVSDLIAEMRRCDGSFRLVNITGRFIESQGRRMLVTQYDDITERKHAEDQLRQAASVFEHANEGILIASADQKILDVNAAFTRITGYARHEALGQPTSLLKSGRHGHEFYVEMWESLNEKGRWTGEIWNRRKNGEIYAELLTITLIRDEEKRAQRFVGLFSDITEFKEHQQRLEHIAHFDVLTNLPNRMLLADRMKQATAHAIRRGNMIAVIYLDLDGFKAVNDTHGHDVGDTLLVQVSRRMKLALREGDTLARLGGDEFVAILLDLEDRDAGTPILWRLLEAAAAPVFVDALVLHVSASVGVTFFPQDDEIGPDQLMRQADQAMYQAKQAGKNRYHLFDTEHDRTLRGRHESIERIRDALENHEFALHYQPKVNLRTGDIVGAEALIRWQHPEQGLLLPASFLPLIEGHELIVSLGDWVIENALIQMETWRTARLTLPVSVNISARQLQSPHFLDKLRAALHLHPEVGQQLEIEVLESSALDDITHASQLIADCFEMGVSFSLDDFGTGYSSLTYLKRLPVQTLKIDQSFVLGMLENTEDLAIVDGIIGLAESFQRQAIAEGVETASHGETLMRLGCDIVQGYAIARPMPAADIPKWIASRRPESPYRKPSHIARDELPILFAMTEHRAWIKALGLYLHETRTAPPPLNHHQCRFGQWLDRAGNTRFAAYPAMQYILELHETIHRRANELLGLKQRGRGEEAWAEFGNIEIEAMSEKLIALMQQLIDGNPHD